jgi:hypothetical protein
MTVWTSPPERIANDGTAYDQPPTHDEAKGRRHLVECQQLCQARKAQREHKTERASRYSAEPRADAGQRRADPIIRYCSHSPLSKCAFADVTGAELSPHPLSQRVPLLLLGQHPD